MYAGRRRYDFTEWKDMPKSLPVLDGATVKLQVVPYHRFMDDAAEQRCDAARRRTMSEQAVPRARHRDPRVFGNAGIP